MKVDADDSIFETIQYAQYSYTNLISAEGRQIALFSKNEWKLVDCWKCRVSDGSA